MKPGRGWGFGATREKREDMPRTEEGGKRGACKSALREISETGKMGID